MTPRFSEKLFPDSLIPVPGAFRKHPRAEKIAGVSAQSMMTEACLDGYLTYYNADSGMTEPIPNALGKAYVIDKYMGSDSVWVWTDSSGYYSVCSEGANASYIDAYFRLNGNYVHNADTSAIARAVGTGRIDVSAKNNWTARVFVNMSASAEQTYSTFQISTPQVTFTVDSVNYNVTRPAYYNVGYGSTYFYSNAVWGSYGQFVAPHEFGHAVQDVDFGWPPVANDGGCPSNGHQMWGNGSLYCAETEGFANYFAIATRPTVLASLLSDIEQSGLTSNSQDGAIIEGAVAGFLLDIADAANEAHDSLALGHHYVATIYQTCKASDAANVFYTANGADHLSYCMENAIDSNVTGSTIYFRSRSPDPAAQQNSAGQPSGWSASKVRAIWRKNLYRGQ